MHYAHSLPDTIDTTDWQPLAEHLSKAARLAAGFAEPFGGQRAAALGALLHDLGKYDPRFGARLRGSTVSFDHARAGAALVRALVPGSPLSGWDPMIAALLAYVIAGHHGGLPDINALSERLKDWSAEALDPVWQAEITPETSSLAPSLPLRSDKGHLPFQLGFLGRMLFSCVVDADYRDTEAFYAKAAGTPIAREDGALAPVLDALIARFDAHLKKLQDAAAPGPVNEARAAILTHARAQAALDPGLFTLSVPTGGGKTLASLGFALDHARRHGHRRVIYALPFTSIIDQTAAIFREVLGADKVLEHHSALDTEAFARHEQRDKLRLAMEDWAYPVIVTTTVQLFESLFANRPSRCRKLHNLAHSVIVIDEAQTLPLDLLRPCVAAMDELAHSYKVSVVLCTATQPALDRASFRAGGIWALDLEGRELAPDPAALARKLGRVHLEQGGPLNDDALVRALETAPQALVIVNSRQHALSLTRAARGAGLEGVVHLSTRQCAADRRAVLATVREALKEGRPCRLIATSLVEAGVDLDFPRVWRALAGLDQLAQAAGRCNREGKRPVDDSVVTVFSTPDHAPPREIERLAEICQRILDKHKDPFSPEALNEYFREVYWNRGPDALDKHEILGCFQANASGPLCSYRKAAEKFQMIEKRLQPVIIARDPQVARILRECLEGPVPRPGLAQRLLQPFIVQVPPADAGRLRTSGDVTFEHEKRFADQFPVLRTDALYSPDLGLLWEEAGTLGMEETIF
ncbi:CRISPR-associated endonuclease Cas3'' [Pararhodospirillum oryzae]|uniref:CRISPR-associated helicase/endonuclease Cas3 n=1 Tax=Pararhodospirillum oryzae TaxID=478448 RepID=A0A512H8S4_9PROT|nr:CRISPR-associated endonuclease Cas3'' [Pararhodospirillum oryzae]GEO81854.1 CRISPR-associated helicase/endonuclease Cas3 [Pararhodospirillum oryzae]